MEKTSLAIILIFVAGFLLINEFQFQISVTKDMTVEKLELWERDFNKIVVIANIFRARVIYADPKYLYCKLEVPVISYRILMFIYNNMGFIAREPIFLTLQLLKNTRS